MTDLVEPLRAFYQELRRRRVLRVAVAYAAVGWAIVEVSATTFPLLFLPDWTTTLVLVLVLLGFPLTVVLAWIFDVEPEGVHRTQSVEDRRDDDHNGSDGDGSHALTRSSSAVKRRRQSNWVVVAGVGLVVAAVIVGTRLATATEETQARVMVLPFENETGDASLDALGQMAAEWISNGLLEIPAIDIVPHQVLMEAVASPPGQRVGGERTTLGRVAEATGADIGVTGAVYRRQDAVEFHAQLVDLSANVPMAIIEPVRGPLDDPLQGIDSLRIQVMGALAARLTPGVAWDLPAAAQPPTYDAYLAFLQGLESWVEADYAAAARSFEEAHARDTTYLRALVWAWASLRNAGLGARADSVEAILRMRRDDLPRYDRYRLDWIDANSRGDHRAALAAARAGTALNPSGTLGFSLALSLVKTGRPIEARKQFEDWLADPGPAANWYSLWIHYARVLHIVEDYQEELDVARRTRDTFHAGELESVEAEARALAALGQLRAFDQRLVEIEALSSGGLSLGWALADLAMELRAHSHREASLELVDRAIRLHADLPAKIRESREGWEALAALLYMRERWPEAADRWAALEAVAEGDALIRAVGRRGASAARSGDRTGAASALQRLATLGPEVPEAREEATLWRARITAVLGDQDQAVDLLRQAFAEGMPYGIWVHRDMDLEPLRGYPPYERLQDVEG